MSLYNFQLYNKLPKNQKFVVFVFTLCVYSWFIAPFSKYYIANIEIFLSVLSLFVLSFFGRGMTTSIAIKQSIQYAVACLIIISIPIIAYGDYPFVSIISKFLFALAFIALKAEYKYVIYDFFINTFIILISLGLIEYVLLFVHINFFWEVVTRSGDMNFYQGLFILVPTYFVNSSFRFMSLCEEPGTFATICFFILQSLDYKIDKYKYIILLISGIISFSLGFYVLIGLWVLIQLKSFRIFHLLLAVVVICLMMTFLGNFFQERIIDRIIGVDIEAIDNRTIDIVD